MKKRSPLLAILACVCVCVCVCVSVWHTKPSLLVSLNLDSQSKVGQLHCCVLTLAGQQQVLWLQEQHKHQTHTVVSTTTLPSCDFIRNTSHHNTIKLCVLWRKNLLCVPEQSNKWGRFLSFVFLFYWFGVKSWNFDRFVDCSVK